VLIQRRCYYGKGMDPRLPYADPLGLVTKGLLPRGWCEDFW